MLSIVTWMWHDPHLLGSRGRTSRGSIVVPQVRADLRLTARQRRIRIAAGRKVDDPAPPPLPPGTPSEPRSFKPAHVNRLRELFAKHLPIPHRFVCIADSTEGFDPKVEVLQTPDSALAAGRHRSPEGNRFPSCYRRLWMFSEEAARVFGGDYVLPVDIDLIPVADCSPIVDRTEEFVGWRPFRDWGRKKRFGGGIYLLKTGMRTRVWTDFKGESSISAARTAGFRGSDQAWLSYCLAEKEAVYGRESGIYSIRDLGSDHALPPDARMVQMNGPDKPWSYRGRASWVAQHWKGR